MAGIDFPKMENRKPEIFISLHKSVKLVATDDNRRNVICKLLGNPAIQEPNATDLGNKSEITKLRMAESNKALAQSNKTLAQSNKALAGSNKALAQSNKTPAQSNKALARPK